MDHFTSILLMMRKYCALLLVILFPGVVHSQHAISDSLKHKLQNNRQDTAKVNTLNALTRFYTSLYPDSAFLYGQQALVLAREAGYKKGEIKALYYLGGTFSATGNYPKAIEYHLAQLREAEALNDPSEIAKAYGGLATDYFYQGNQRLAIDYDIKGLEIYRKNADKSSALTSLINLGDTYEKMNILDSAMLYTKEAFAIAAEKNNEESLGIIYNNFGNIYLKLGEDDTAMRNYRQSIPYRITSGNVTSLTETYLGMAMVFRKLGNRDSCQHYAKLSLSIAKSTSNLAAVMTATNYLSEYYTSLKNTDSAFAYLKAHISAKDSLFSQDKERQIQNMFFEEKIRQQQIEDIKKESQTKLQFNILFGSIATLVLVAFLLVRNNRQKQKANQLLLRQNHEIEEQRDRTTSALQQLQQTQNQLVHAEKMASLGELTAGIAHEIQNPLNFVNNFSDINTELIQELTAALESGNLQDATGLAGDIARNEAKINHHGKRADAIVKGMLQHSRTSSGLKEPTDINTLCDEYLRLAYHGLRAKDKSFNTAFETNFDPALPRLQVVPQELGRVILNLINNAFYAVSERLKTESKKPGSAYKPVVQISTRNINGSVEIRINDNGTGIPGHVKEKIFHPFFTTKPTGQGTGLGLSLSYDIIKAHGGDITVETKEGEGTTFVVVLPV